MIKGEPRASVWLPHGCSRRTHDLAAGEDWAVRQTSHLLQHEVSKGLRRHTCCDGAQNAHALLTLD